MDFFFFLMLEGDIYAFLTAEFSRIKSILYKFLTLQYNRYYIENHMITIHVNFYIYRKFFKNISAVPKVARMNKQTSYNRNLAFPCKVLSSPQENTNKYTHTSAQISIPLAHPHSIYSQVLELLDLVESLGMHELYGVALQVSANTRHRKLYIILQKPQTRHTRDLQDLESHEASERVLRHALYAVLRHEQVVERGRVLERSTSQRRNRVAR